MIFEKVEKVQSGAEKGFIIISAAIIGLMMLITTGDVVLRYIFNHPLPGMFILCEMFMVCAVYLSVAYVQQQKEHVRVDIIIDKLKGSPRIAIELSIFDRIYSGLRPGFLADRFERLGGMDDRRSCHGPC